MITDFQSITTVFVRVKKDDLDGDMKDLSPMILPYTLYSFSPSAVSVIASFSSEERVREVGSALTQKLNLVMK